MNAQRTKIVRALHVCKKRCAEYRILTAGFLIAVGWGVVGGLLYAFFLAAPAHVETPSIFTIKKGEPLSAIARHLKEEGLVRSSSLFMLLTLVQGGDAVAGSYFLPDPQNVFTLARRVHLGDYELSPIKITFPEGVTAAEMAQILSLKLGTFDEEHFMALVQGKEGFLFPDTYYFLPGTEPEVVVQALEENFFKKIASIQDDVTAFGKPLQDIVTMASLLEEEARTFESRRIIAGILWKRIDRGMRLQVDAVFPYIIGKNTFDLTMADLSTNSPYNTYLYEGLPLGPISNPGLSSLQAAIQPVGTPYLYYLSDLKGNFHYSRTYEEHLRKKRLYLGS